MNRIQLQAGYILDGINKALMSINKTTQVRGLLKHLSYFDVETGCNISSKSHDSLASVIHNIIVRGLPTRPSVFIEDKFAKAFKNYLLENSKMALQLGNIEYVLEQNDNEANQLFEALHIVDPRITIDKSNYNFSLESSFEEDFIFRYLPNNDLEYLQQVLESQRLLDTIVKPEATKKHISQRTDFSYEFPYQLEEHYEEYGEQKIRTFHQGLLIEIDGSSHQLPAQRFLDEQRDRSVKDTKWIVRRIKNLEDTKFANWISTSSSLKVIKENHKKELSKNWLNIIQLTLSPFAIARVQKMIVELILSNNLDLNAETWEILAIERDVPCVELAIEDLKLHFEKLYTLAGKELNFPTINIQVLSTKEFINSKLHSIKPELIEEFKSDKEFDLIIDISVLQRNGILKNEIPFNYKDRVVIRSSHSVKTIREIYTSDFIDYKPLTIKKEDESYEDIEETKEIMTFFLQNIFM